jgi:uncharacterized phage protein gp47/JayE
MAFIRPTLQELITRVEGDVKSGLGLVTLIRRSVLKVLARVMAGLAHLLFGFFTWLEKQAFPDTAEEEYLERWASIWGVTRVAATFSEFTCDVTGTPGTVIPVNRTYRRTDGAEYNTLAEVTLDGMGEGEIELVAALSGEAYAPEVADVLTILSPIAGLDSNATVTAITTEAADTESDESLQERLIDRIQNPPSGGAANDYVQWAREVAGVTRAWVGPLALGPGTVTVWFVTDGEDPITPSGAKITEVAEYIEELRPVTANVNVAAPVLFPIDLTIAIDPNTASVQEAIEQELQDLILRDAAVAGAWKGPTENYDGKILLSRINEAISIAAGESDHEVIDINTDPPADVEPADGELAVLGTITWQTLA